MAPRLRKAGLVAHITCSVGWLGSVLAFVALAVVVLTTDEAELRHASYLAMDTTAAYVIVPLALGSLVTGVVQSVGTTWGLVRHYWVVLKLIINVFASIVLLLYLQTLEQLATSAERSVSPLLHASAALVLLLAATVLSVYKPRGLTRRGQRALRARQLLG